MDERKKQIKWGLSCWFPTKDEFERVKKAIDDRNEKSYSAFLYRLVYNELGIKNDEPIPEPKPIEMRGDVVKETFEKIEPKEMLAKIVKYMKEQPSQEAKRGDIYDGVPMKKKDRAGFQVRKREIDKLMRMKPDHPKKVN